VGFLCGNSDYHAGANDDGTTSSGNELGSTTGTGAFSTVDCQLYRSVGNGNNPGCILGISPLFRVQPNPPAKPMGFTATVGDGQVTLSWSDPNNTVTSLGGSTTSTPDWPDTWERLSVDISATYSFPIRAVVGTVVDAPSTTRTLCRTTLGRPMRRCGSAGSCAWPSPV